MQLMNLLILSSYYWNVKRFLENDSKVHKGHSSSQNVRENRTHTDQRDSWLRKVREKEKEYEIF